jgi:hypothetical protein
VCRILRPQTVEVKADTLELLAGRINQRGYKLKRYEGYCAPLTVVLTAFFITKLL